MNPYIQEKIMFAHQQEIAAKIRHNRLVEQAKRIKRENEAEAEETAGTSLRQQLGEVIVRFGYKVAGRPRISLEVKG